MLEVGRQVKYTKGNAENQESLIKTIKNATDFLKKILQLTLFKKKL